MYIQLNKDDVRIGVVSDTHGQVRRELYSVLSGVEYILHAGDIGNLDTLTALEKIAPVCAVLGNTDSAFKFPDLSETVYFETIHSRLLIIHDRNRLDIDPASAGFNGVIYGHSHEPSLKYHNKVLYLNPGSCGPRRFDLPVCVATMTIRGSEIQAELIKISI